MNQKRDLNEQDWARIQSALDLYLRCQIGQLKDAFEIFMKEFEERTRENPDINESHKQMDINRVKWALERAEKEIAITAFGSVNASFGVKSLDDPIRQLIIQADLRYCNFSDDVTKCPDYPSQCAAPTTGWCPKKEAKKEFSLPYPSTSMNEARWAVVGYHRDLGGGILTWNKKKSEALANKEAINKAGGKAEVVTKESADSAL